MKRQLGWCALLAPFLLAAGQIGGKCNASLVFTFKEGDLTFPCETFTNEVAARLEGEHHWKDPRHDGGVYKIVPPVNNLVTGTRTLDGTTDTFEFWTSQTDA